MGIIQTYTEADLGGIVSHPEQWLRTRDQFLAEQSLLNFMKLGWAALEPGVELVENYGLAAICDHLMAVTYKQIQHLLMNVPPGSSKSMSTSVFWPAWEWGPMGFPHYRYISFAHEQGLAVRDLRRCRDLINSPWYQALWGDQFGWKPDQNAKMYYENDQTGWRQACAAASLTGRRGDRVIGDDPHSVKGADSEADRENVLQIYSETVPTRLNNPDSSIICIMQRVHEMDVSGLILAKELNYTHLCLPMEFEIERRCYTPVRPSFVPEPKLVWVYRNEKEHRWQKEMPEPEEYSGDKPERQKMYSQDIRKKDGDLLDPVRFPRETVEELKKNMSAWGGSYAVAGQLQQRPAPRGGGLFKKKDFQIIDKVSDLQSAIAHTVRGYDLAASDDKDAAYTVGVKMSILRNGAIVIHDIDRYQETPGKVEANILACAKRDGKQVPIDMPQDPGQAGKAQKASYVKLLHGFTVKFSPESGDKEQRAGPFAAQVEGGNVYLIRGEWNDAFLDEAAVFPAGKFKDQVDGCSRGYMHLVNKTKKGPRGAPGIAVKIVE